MPLSLPIEAKANDLLARDRLALLIGMVLDQQVTLEKAFSSPYDLVQRLGHEPTAKELADYDTDALIEVFAQRPALHRFPKAMAVRVQEACRLIVDRYDGDVEKLWTGAQDGKELLKRISELPGFGKQKAQIMVALLGKQYGVQPKGWRAAAGDFGAARSYKSVADIVDGDSLVKVRMYKQQLKAAAKAE
ncbi:MAG: Fe-S cluster assembly protein HesB [Actinobacteria bacterium 13_1_20CM_3_71_11]|nr:MAG: Fe-S cluster assembly protein HesB [Actinobacteria bacterium 13_1_20CM_3_71_11]